MDAEGIASHTCCEGSSRRVAIWIWLGEKSKSSELMAFDWTAPPGKLISPAGRLLLLIFLEGKKQAIQKNRQVISVIQGNWCNETSSKRAWMSVDLEWDSDTFGTYPKI
uniref:Uncharacterized protein n=1 Tax=Ditylenchus dipsaci TaxID=166011 RepID=A0A915CPH4_9BILA